MWTLQKKGAAQLGLVELGRSSSDLSRVPQRTARLSQRLLSWLGEHFCVPGLFTGPHLPGPCLGPHFRQQWHISIHLSIWCCTNSPKKCAVTFTTNLHNAVCYCRTQTQAFPHLIHAMKMFFSSLPFQKTRSLTCYKPLASKTSAKPLNCLCRPSPSHMPWLHWNIPLENPSLLF